MHNECEHSRWLVKLKNALSVSYCDLAPLLPTLIIPHSSFLLTIDVTYEFEHSMWFRTFQISNNEYKFQNWATRASLASHLSPPSPPPPAAFRSGSFLVLFIPPRTHRSSSIVIDHRRWLRIRNESLTVHRQRQKDEPSLPFFRNQTTLPSLTPPSLLLTPSLFSPPSRNHS